MRVFSWTTLFITLIIIYISFTAQKLYDMMHPLNGITVDLNNNNNNIIHPNWLENTSFSLVCYISKHPKPYTNNIDSIQANSHSNTVVVWTQKELNYTKIHKEITHEITLISSRSNSNKLTSYSNNTSTLPDDLWYDIRHNQSSIYLHVLIQRDNPPPQDSKLTVKNKTIKGSQLVGSVQLIKYDKIPKSYRQRYLLSDFGLVNISSSDG